MSLYATPSYYSLPPPKTDHPQNLPPSLFPTKSLQPLFDTLLPDTLKGLPMSDEHIDMLIKHEIVLQHLTKLKDLDHMALLVKQDLEIVHLKKLREEGFLKSEEPELHKVTSKVDHMYT